MQKEINRFMAGRRRQLTAINRRFPKFHEGMSTGEYVSLYTHLNRGSFDKQRAEVLPINLADYLNPCGLYDPLTPLCEETTEA